ncbi:hypothetical protein BaRGS_00027563 [Batillaria attramentaria]|uniref:HTH psq-type domain-containing protein n=1 Tax=Batillaria attramentaria TaxID=370345 RepID=A0ABD0K378_9CAEN
MQVLFWSLSESDWPQRYTGKHDPRLINEAAMRVRMKQLTLRKAAEIYKIPRSTISDRVTGRVKMTPTTSSSTTIPVSYGERRQFETDCDSLSDDSMRRGETETE